MVLILNSSKYLGGKAIGIPGEIKGYWEAHQKYGKVSWRELFEPTIKMCQEGVEVTRALASAITRSESYVRSQDGLG